MSLAVLTIIPSPAWISSAACIGALALGAAAAWVLAVGYRRIAETTLVAPWCWAVLSLAVQMATQLLAEASPEPAAPDWLAPVRYLAAITTLGPVMAVLGAKRPQNRAWQFIVLSLLVVLALPAAQTILLRRGPVVVLHTAQVWFLVILVAVGWLNYLPTRYWLAASALALGQLCLLGQFLGWLEPPLWRLPTNIGLAFELLALILALLWPAAPRTVRPLDRVWLDFRNALGAAWGLRVQERFNATARMSGWPASLTWHGLSIEPGEGRQLTADDDEAMQKCLTTLVRRFVSAGWVERRLAQS